MNKNKEHISANISVNNILSHTRATLLNVFDEGREKGKNSLYELNGTQHIERALRHLKKHLEGDREENHLTHALWRIAIGVYKNENGGMNK